MHGIGITHLCFFTQHSFEAWLESIKMLMGSQGWLFLKLRLVAKEYAATFPCSKIIIHGKNNFQICHFCEPEIKRLKNKSINIYGMLTKQNKFMTYGISF
jgi:hypothetical protein